MGADENAETAPAPAVPWRAGLAAAGTSVMFGFVPLAARGLYGDGLSTWSLLCWRYLLALAIIFAAIRITRLRVGTALRHGAWRIAVVGLTLGRRRPFVISRACGGSTPASRSSCSIPSRWSPSASSGSFSGSRWRRLRCCPSA
jgi:hypothetical protein